jgi:hypothetical protein
MCWRVEAVLPGASSLRSFVREIERLGAERLRSPYRSVVASCRQRATCTRFVTSSLLNSAPT